MPTKVEKDSVTGRETTGHQWDGLKELNTPLPRWWLYVFYACIAFAIFWAIIYPSIPMTGARGLSGWTARGAIGPDLEAERLSRELLLDPYYTPHDSAMGLLALGQYFRARKATATYRGTLSHGGKVIGSFDGKTTRFPNVPAAGELLVTLENGYVADAAYYTVRVRGTPAAPLGPAAART